MSDTRYILFTGSMQPKNPMLATEDKIKEIVGAGFKQGKDFDIVSEKVLKDKLGRRGGGMMNINEMIRPLGYKMGTREGELVGDKEKVMKAGILEDADDLRTLTKRYVLLKSLADDYGGKDVLKKMDAIRDMSPAQIEIEYLNFMTGEES